MPSILLVDDDPGIRVVLRESLLALNHRVVEADSGEAALALLDRDPELDAAILDVRMPGMDGFELLGHIRKRGGLPVMVVSAAPDPKLRDRALFKGADDFLAKPFDLEDFTARLGFLLDARAQRKALARKHAELVALQEFQQDLAGLLVHDLKNPLTVIRGNLDYLSDIMRESAQRDTLEALDDMQDAMALLQRMIGNLVDVGMAEAGRLSIYPEPFVLGDLLESVARGRRRAAEQIGITLTVRASPVVIEADRDVLHRLLSNLLENALRYVGARGRISMAATVDGDRVELRVSNTGPSVPVELRRVVFEKYGPVRRRSGTPRVDLGLGLYFCRLAAESHGGSIRVEETPDYPTSFVIQLPRRSRPLLSLS